MVDMRMTKQQVKEDMIGMASPSNGRKSLKARFPYGLRITLNGPQLEKLKALKDPEVGDLVGFEGHARIVRVRIEEDQEEDGKTGKEREVSLQIEDIDFFDNDQDGE